MWADWPAPLTSATPVLGPARLVSVGVALTLGFPRTPAPMVHVPAVESAVKTGDVAWPDPLVIAVTKCGDAPGNVALAPAVGVPKATVTPGTGWPWASRAVTTRGAKGEPTVTD